MPPGRPTKFTEETRNKIITALRGGNYRPIAAQYAGIAPSTLRKWLLTAQDPSAPPEYLEFLAAVEKAEADAEIADIALIRKAAQDGTWSAAAWIRERKNPERWGRRDRTQVELTGVDGGPLDVRVSVGADVDSIVSLAAVLAGRFAERQDPVAGELPVEVGGEEVFRIVPGELSAGAPSLRKVGVPGVVGGHVVDGGVSGLDVDGDGVLDEVVGDVGGDGEGDGWWGDGVW